MSLFSFSFLFIYNKPLPIPEEMTHDISVTWVGLVRGTFILLKSQSHNDIWNSDTVYFL